MNAVVVRVVPVGINSVTWTVCISDTLHLFLVCIDMCFCYVCMDHTEVTACLCVSTQMTADCSE